MINYSDNINRIMALNRERKNNKITSISPIATDFFPLFLCFYFFSFIPISNIYRGNEKPVKKWNFNGASLDQGLLYYTYVMTHGNVVLLDSGSNAYKYGGNYTRVDVDGKDLFEFCGGVEPVDSFVHFTGGLCICACIYMYIGIFMCEYMHMTKGIYVFVNVCCAIFVCCLSVFFISIV